jgi:hypothetical protein
MATGDPVPGQPGSFEAPIKVAVRSDEESGMATAWLGPNDGSEPGTEGWVQVASICTSIAGEHPEVYEAWKGLLAQVARRVTEHVMSRIVGRPVEVSGPVIYNPHPGESEGE